MYAVGESGRGARQQHGFKGHHGVFESSEEYDEPRIGECHAKTMFVPRPDQGTEGKPITLVTNYFRIKVPSIAVFLYRLKITEIKSGRAQESSEDEETNEAKLRKLKQYENQHIFEKFLQDCREDFANAALPVFDGTENVYCNSRLTLDQFSKVVAVDVYGEKQYLVEIKYVEEIHLGAFRSYYDGELEQIPEKVMKAVETILRHGPASKNVAVKSSLYLSGSESKIEIGDIKLLSFGHNQSVWKTQVGPSLLINTCATAFYDSGALCDLIRKLGYDLRHLSRYHIEQLSILFSG